jgi:hypothetical protein
MEPLFWALSLICAASAVCWWHSQALTVQRFLPLLLLAITSPQRHTRDAEGGPRRPRVHGLRCRSGVSCEVTGGGGWTYAQKDVRFSSRLSFRMVPELCAFWVPSRIAKSNDVREGGLILGQGNCPLLTWKCIGCSEVKSWHEAGWRGLTVRTIYTKGLAAVAVRHV